MEALTCLATIFVQTKLRSTSGAAPILEEAGEVEKQERASQRDTHLLQEYESIMAENLKYVERIKRNRHVMATLMQHIKNLETDALTAKAQQALKARQVQ